MDITIVGAGAIGGNLARKLSAAGHDVQVADARGAASIPPDVLESGARAVELDAAAVRDRDVVVLSVPYDRVPELKELLAPIPASTVVIDTSNYYPQMNGNIAAVDDGQVESVRNAELLGRPVVKTWNAALAGTQQAKGTAPGTPSRIAIPIAGDSQRGKQVAMQLVDDTGFDPFDAGVLADSWRMQPGTPAYCTELNITDLEAALASADRAAAPPIRDRLMDRFTSLPSFPSLDEVVETNRAAHREESGSAQVQLAASPSSGRPVDPSQRHSSADGDRDTTAQRLGRTGIRFPWSGFESLELSDTLAELENDGWGAVWFAGSAATTQMAIARRLLDHSQSITVATGIISIFASDPAETAALNRALLDDHPGRFLLGLGVSHPEGSPQGAWGKPLAAMRSFLADLDNADADSDRSQRVLAALGPKMLQMSAELAGGAHPYFVPVEHTALAREQLGAGPLLAPEQMVVLETDPARARQTARRGMKLYLGLSNYTKNLRQFGFGDDDFNNGGSDRLVDAIVAWGDPDSIAAAIRAQHDAGADHVCVQVLSDHDSVPRQGWRQLAEALASCTGGAGLAS